MFSQFSPYHITISLEWHDPQELRKVIQELTRAVCSGGFSEWRYSNPVGRRWRWRPLVVVPSWDDDVLYIYMCVYLCISLFTYLFIYIYICVYVYIDLIYIYIHTYIYLYLLFFIYTHIYIGRKRCRHGCRDVDWNDFLLRICNMYICSTLLSVCIYIGERLEVPRNIEEPCDTIIHVWSSNIQKGGGVLASFELR